MCSRRSSKALECRCLGERNAPEHVSEAKLGQLVSVLQGGATEMSEKHRPPDETFQTGLTGFPGMWNGERKSTMRPHEQALALKM